MTRLLIDAGNTNCVFAVADDHHLLGQWRISTDVRRTADEYGMWLLPLLERQGIVSSEIHLAVAASVVPQAMFELRQLCAHYFSTELQALGEEITDIGMEVRIDQPREVGADRLVNAYGAWRQFKQPLIVLDFGTATTFDVVSEDGAYIGGVIAPGVNLSLQALQKAAARLPNVQISSPGKVIGTNTVNAMQSGMYYGYLALIEGMVAKIRAEYGKSMKVVATGGLAPLYANDSTAIEDVLPDLTLEGLMQIAHTLSSSQPT